MIRFDFHTDHRPAEFERLFKVLSPAARRALLEKTGFLVKQQARQNALAKHGTAKRPSTKGGGFWAGIADSVSYQVLGDEMVEVGASHEAAAHKHFGGTITAPGKGPGARGAKWLTIPISPLSRGAGGVKFLKTKYNIFRVGIILFATRIGAKSGKGTIAEPVYVLKKSVTQKPEPWWPDQGAIFKSVSEAVDLIAGRP